MKTTVVPGFLNYFDTEAVISPPAPRAILFMTGDEDTGSPVSGIPKIDAEFRPVYTLYKKADAFENIIYPKTGHVYLRHVAEDAAMDGKAIVIFL